MMNKKLRANKTKQPVNEKQIRWLLIIAFGVLLIVAITIEYVGLKTSVVSSLLATFLKFILEYLMRTP